VVISASLNRTLAGVFAFAALCAPVVAQDVVSAPRLGVSSNFGQGLSPDMLDFSRALPVTEFRDEVFWSEVERTDGQYSFERDKTNYPDRIAEFGGGVTLIMNNGHPAYDNGQTPSSDRAVAAFARYAGAAVARFPAVTAIEVGNEVNSDTFVSGPLWTADFPERAAVYTKLLAATATAVRVVDPDIRILGGAAHSIPLAWFSALIDAGALAYMDAIVLHTYTSAPEQVRRQISLLRELPGLENFPIEVTEFGRSDADFAPATLLNNYCQMALAGVTSVMWYPLSPRGDGLTPLLNDRGRITDVGRTYRLIEAELTGRPVRDVAPDRFTYACLFGDETLVIWGAARPVYLTGPGMQARDVTGNALPLDSLTLSRDTPVIITSQGGPIELGKSVTLGPQQVIADSYDQFAYPGARSAGVDPFNRFARQKGKDIELETRAGQERNGVPWTPYLGTDHDGVVRAEAGQVFPSAWGDDAIDVIYRYTTETPVRFDLTIEIAPDAKSTDGVKLTVKRDNRLLGTRTITTAQKMAFSNLTLQPGATLDIIVGPGASAKSDLTRLRVTLRHPLQ
jgi:hypothetical protein